MERDVVGIEVGAYEDKVGYTLTYSDGERAHFLFSRPVARHLVAQMTRVLDDIDYIVRQLPGDSVQVGESVAVRIAPPASAA